MSQNVHTGDEIAQIAPDNSSLAIKGLVRNADISKVKIGQQVQIRIWACPYPDYGTLKGEVIKISPDAISLEEKIASPTSPVTAKQGFYEVTIKPFTNSLRKQGQSCNLQLGMEGRADIISREETMIKFLLRKARLITDL